jgi:hypothetical protein
VFVVVLAGLALTGSHLLVGLLLTPFFGDGPFLWANIFLSLLLSLLGGVLLDSSRIQRLLSKDRCAWLYLLLGSLWLGATPLALTTVTRAILDADPDSFFSAFFAIVLLLTLPGLLLSGALPATVRCRPKNQQLRGGQMLLGGFLGGATLGVLVSLPALLSAEYPALILLGVLAWLPLFFAAWLSQGWGRPVLGVLGISLASFLLFAPGELESLEYRTALRRSYKLHVGRYYLATANRRVLNNTDIRHEYERIVESLKDKEDPAAAAIIGLVKALKNLGPVETTGAGLGETLRELISEDTRRYLLPFLEPVEKISSDGKGRISFVIKPGHRGKAFKIPWAAKADEEVLEFVLKEDFTLALTQQTSVTNIRIEPEKVEKAGFFEMNETHTTPVKIKDVKFFVDAHLLGCSIENSRTRILIKIEAQGSVGEVTEHVIHVIEK